MIKLKTTTSIIAILALVVSFAPNLSTARNQEGVSLPTIDTTKATINLEKSTTPTIPKCNIFTTDLNRGDTGQAVDKMQQFLNQEGYEAGDVDGVFGYNTWLAVLTFQERHAEEILHTNGFSKATGNWSSYTRLQANKVACSDPTKVYQTPPVQIKEESKTPSLTKQAIIDRLLVNPHNSYIYENCQHQFTAVKTEGDIGQEVVKIQEFLKKQNLYQDELDGVYDTNVSISVKNFQEKYFTEILTKAGFTQTTGVWGPSTFSQANKVQKCS